MKRNINQTTNVILEDVDKCDGEFNMPQKKFFRARAHCNPLSHNNSFNYPLTPKHYNWETHYPNIPVEDRVVRHVDIGMGFGGLTVALAKIYPDKLVLGMEIRAKLCEYVRLRCDALRLEFPGSFQNASCLRSNCMRYMPNYFERRQLEKIFICFADPHFKAKNHKRRIISQILLSEYAYFMKPGGKLYTVTDVEELHNWQVRHCTAHPYFRRIPDGSPELLNDPAVQAMLEETEESKKVARLGGRKHYAVFERLDVDEACEQQPLLENLFEAEEENTSSAAGITNA